MILSSSDRMKKVKEVGDATRLDALEKLHEYGRCLVDRPTGFGKTYLLCKVASKYIKDYPNKNIIYIYPNEIIVNEIMSNDEYDDVKDKMTYFSYQKIAQSFSENGKGSSKELILDELKNASIILVDEVHRAGATGFQTFFSSVDSLIGVDKVHLLGVTATIDRSKKEETDWIKNTMFDGIEAYEYTLGNAIDDGVLLPPVIHRPIFDIKERVETVKGELKEIHAKTKHFNERELDRKLQELSLDFQDNGMQIYTRIYEVGYRLDSDNPDDSYLKFIVFFKDTNHMVQEGAKIEGYFRDAITRAASTHLQKDINTTMSVEYVISDTADNNNEYIVKKFCDEEDFRTYRNKPVEVGTYVVEEDCAVIDESTGRVKLDKDGNRVTKRVKSLEYIKPKAKHLDLIFNVGTIIMGYHVPYTSGVMMLRVTGTNIMFYQQIGRCFSAKASKMPIIFDVVSNTNKDYSSNDIKKIMYRGTSSDGVREQSEPKVGLERDSATQVGYDEDATQKFLNTLNAMRNVDYFFNERILYLYEQRNMPILYIANDLQVSCKKVIKVLQSFGINIVSEDNEYRRIITNTTPAEDDTEEKIAWKEDYRLKILRYINSKKANSYYSKNKSERLGKSLYDLLVSMGLGGKKKK